MRLANKNDIDELVNLRVKEQQEDWKDKYEDKFGLFNTTKSYLENHLNEDFFAFIEKDNNNIIATCCLQIIEYLPQCNDNGKQGFICNVYTRPEYRKRGVQTKLLNEVIDFAIKNKLCELDLSTDSDSAIPLYKKLGFEFDDWAMKKELKQ